MCHGHLDRTVCVYMHVFINVFAYTGVYVYIYTWMDGRIGSRMDGRKGGWIGMCACRAVPCRDVPWQGKSLHAMPYRLKVSSLVVSFIH